MCHHSALVGIISSLNATFNDQEGVYYLSLVSYRITAKTSADRAAYEIPFGALKNCGVRVHLVGFGVNRAPK